MEPLKPAYRQPAYIGRSVPKAGARKAALLFDEGEPVYERGDTELDGERNSRAHSPLEEELRAMRRFVELNKKLLDLRKTLADRTLDPLARLETLVQWERTMAELVDPDGLGL